MVLVVGATGLVGSEVCRKLRARGERVRALVRATSSETKVEALRSCGAELFLGDLKDPDSIRRACAGMEAIISTASSTLSRQPGDSIDSVDAQGQLNLVEAAQAERIRRFILVSFRHSAGLSFPLDDAKQQVETAIQRMDFTTIQASLFMEVWLSPALGFDYPNARARIYGSGRKPVSWVSSQDVAEMCAIAVRDPAAERCTIEFGGPEAMTPLEVVSTFERIHGRHFEIEHVPESALRAQFDEATDPMQKTFAALMLGCASGDAIDMTAVSTQYGISLTSLEGYARKVS